MRASPNWNAPMRACLALLLSLLAAPALAADNNFPTPGNATAPGTVNMCWNGTVAVPCSATSPLPTSAGPYNYTPLTPGQYGLGVVASTALTIPAGALQANVCVETQSVRYTYDGTTTPTASVGLLLTAGQCIQFSGAAVLANLKFIQTAATAALDVGYTK